MNLCKTLLQLKTNKIFLCKMKRQSQERLEIADKEKEVALEDANKKFEQNLQERDQLHIKVSKLL